jgi:predicted SAM-dependent methyltransferase
MKLNIGSHNVRVDGFLNVDILDLPGVDIVCDITKIPWTVKGVAPQEKFEDDSVDEILMVEVLEHISFHDTAKVLAEIYRVLKPGGKLHIQLPDCGAMMEMFVRGEISSLIPHKPQSVDQVLQLRKETGMKVNPMRWLMAFCGAQKYGVPDIHKNIFTKESMQEYLEEAGFESIDFKEDPLEWKIKVNVIK